MKQKSIQAYTCYCGGRTVFTTDTFSEEVKGKNIIIHNFPHYICSKCEDSQYRASNSLIDVLKYAVANHLNEVDFREWLININNNDLECGSITE